MISDRRKRGNRLVMRRRSGRCCVSYRNRIRGWILARRRLGKCGKGSRGVGQGEGKGEGWGKGEGESGRNEEVVIAVYCE